MTPTGLELVDVSADSTNQLEKQPSPSAAKSGAFSADSGTVQSLEAPDTDPELTQVIAAWPTLPEPIRAAILAMVKATGRVD
jgi:hypothetical protein